MQRVQDAGGGWCSASEGTTIEFKSLDMILGIRGVVESRGDFPYPSKICGRDPEADQDIGLQGYNYTNGIELEVVV